MPPSLTRVKRAAARRVSASEEYRSALEAAQADGHSLRVIAQAAGVSHVAVLKMLRDYPEGSTEKFSPGGS